MDWTSPEALAVLNRALTGNDVVTPIVDARLKRLKAEQDLQIQRAQEARAQGNYDHQTTDWNRAQEAYDPNSRQSQVARQGLDLIAKDAGVDTSGYSAADAASLDPRLARYLELKRAQAQQAALAEDRAADNARADRALDATMGQRDAIQALREAQLAETTRHNEAAEATKMRRPIGRGGVKKAPAEMLPDFNDDGTLNVENASRNAVSLGYKSPNQYIEQLRKQTTVQATPLTPGEKAQDTAFGKDYVEWTGGGKAQVEKNLGKLDSVLQTLEQRKNDLFGTSGRLTGRLPDWMRSQESVNLRDTVAAAIMGTLRPTLGAQFTENEGKRMIAQSYDEHLDPAQNIPRLQAAIQELKQKVAAKEQQSRQFEHSGSLRGWNQGAQQAAPDTAAQPRKQYSPSRNQTRLVYPDGRVEVVDGRR